MRVLTRIHIRLRWPMALIAALTVALTIWSFFSPVNLMGAHMGATIEGGQALLAEGRTEYLDFTGALRSKRDWEYRCGDDWYSFGARTITLGDTDYCTFIDFPTWAIALPALAIALLGFRAKARQPKPGQCAACRHTLAGALVCPECGRTTPTKSNPAHAVRAR